ncbi:hypothetical protein HanRHA438_Chr08g0363461 [Helianthus annuus]|nr:hypothetical protein HanRHA438_Chr08g0363461 [Helianthus annuus]
MTIIDQEPKQRPHRPYPQPNKQTAFYNPGWRLEHTNEDLQPLETCQCPTQKTCS